MLAEGGSARAIGPILRAAGLVRAAGPFRAAGLVRAAGPFRAAGLVRAAEPFRAAGLDSAAVLVQKVGHWVDIMLIFIFRFARTRLL